MPIEFNEQNRRFTLTTAHTEYTFSLVAERFLMHTYYGKKGAAADFTAGYRAFSPYPAEMGESFSLDDALSEFSFFGSGDFRCSSLKMRCAAGDCCTRFEYCGYKVFGGRADIPGIPSAKADENTETLAVILADEFSGCELTLYYTLFPQYDVITRYFTLENKGDTQVKLEKAMSVCLDLPGHDYDMISLYGAHFNERNIQRVPLFYGNQSVFSRRGASSHQFNPFIALVSKETDETKGDVYAFNLVYSGCFLDECEVDQSGNTRVGIGLGEENFAYTLEPGEKFTSPEGVMLYSSGGLGDMSRKMHAFVRNTILPPEPFPKRPVVLNTWEACYFDIDEKVLVDFAAEGVKSGLDMLVMDDGWFGERNHDRAGLGDWYPNLNKFPAGLGKFISRVKESGISFGIWIEPEMINPDSELYRAHPEWCLQCKGRENSLSRNQLVLDMSNPDVLDYLKKTFRKTLSGIGIDYIKWDFNRHLSEAGSLNLPADRQDEIFYRFQLGVYELYYWFIENFPGVMIENCSGGGGRYDLAMMALSTQIWTSDNTDAKSRVKIQYGSSLAYPASVMSCHVSNPGNGDDRLARLDYKYKVALGGMLGYELNILHAEEDVKQNIKNQIGFYRKAENIIKRGDLYRLLSPFEDKNEASAYYYSENGERILFSYLQNRAAETEETLTFKITAAKDGVYTDAVTGENFSGEEMRRGIEIKTALHGEYGVLRLLERKKA